MMKFAGAATLGYFSLSGVAAISGMAPSAGGPIPTDICGTLEDSLVTGDFPANSDPGRYFVKYNRQNRDTFRAFVKCVPYSQIASMDNLAEEGFDNQHTLDDIKARRRYAAMFVRRDRMGLYKCDRLNGGNDGWVMKAGWNIKDCPAVEGGKWNEFFPSNAQVRIAQEVTEWENPYEGLQKDCPSDNHYYHGGAWVASPCADENYAILADDSCVAMSDMSFLEITTLQNGMNQIAWSDANNEVKGIPCGYKVEEVELTQNGKLRSFEISNTGSTIEWMPTILDELQYLNSFSLVDQDQFTNFEPAFFQKLGRPKKMKSVTMSGMSVDVDHQWPRTFFGKGDGMGRMETLEISDMSGMTAFKEDWTWSFVGLQNLYVTDNPNLAEIPASMISRWNDDNEIFDISENAITSWPVDAEGNPAAFGDSYDNASVDISGNGLTSVPQSVFENMDSALEGSGWQVDMRDNACTPIVDICEVAATCACNE